MNSTITTYAVITPEIIKRTSKSVIIQKMHHHQRRLFRTFNNINYKFSYHCLTISLSNDQNFIDLRSLCKHIEIYFLVCYKMQ